MRIRRSSHANAVTKQQLYKWKKFVRCIRTVQRIKATLGFPSITLDTL